MTSSPAGMPRPSRTPCTERSPFEHRQSASTESFTGKRKRSPIDDGNEGRERPSPAFAKSDASKSLVEDTPNLNKRYDIERRCLDLSPPITPSLLIHMDAFQAAVAAPNELTDEAWEALRPKLLTQRRQAETRLGAFEDPATKSIGVVSARATLNNSGDTLQDRLGDLADEIIRESWSNGRSVNRQNSPQFASEILDQVRRAINEDTNFQRTKVSLDHMKKLFTEKIERHVQTKELFRCGYCNTTKFFIFEGLINHCAAKHSNLWNVSQSSAGWYHVDWPLNPPFRTHGSKSYRSGSKPKSSTNQNLHGTYLTSNPAFHGGSGVKPPVVQQIASPAFVGSTRYPAPPVFPGHVPPAGYSGYPGTVSPFTSGHSLTPYATPHPPAVGPWQSPAFSSPLISSGIPDFHKSQLDEVANISCGVWDALHKVRSIKQSVLVYVIIHHVVSRFQNRFSNEPNLDLFTECLVNHPMMRGLKDIQNLACKTCVSNNESHEEAHSQAFSLMSGARKFYSFSSLLTHFKNVHVEGSITAEDTRVDWKEDMVELESGPQDITDLASDPRMDRTKFALLEKVFPNLFQRAQRVDSGPSHASILGDAHPSARGSSIVKREVDDQPYYILGPRYSDSGWSSSDQGRSSDHHARSTVHSEASSSNSRFANTRPVEIVPHDVAYVPMGPRHNHEIGYEPSQRSPGVYQAPPSRYLDARPGSPHYRFVEFLPDGRSRPVYIPAGNHYEEPVEYVYLGRREPHDYSRYGNEDDYP